MAAVHVQGSAAHHLGVVRNEEQHRFRAVFLGRNEAQRNAPGDLPDHLLPAAPAGDLRVDVAPHWRPINPAQAHRVDADAEAAKILGHVAGQRVQPAFAGGVGAFAREGVDRAHGGDIDDGAAVGALHGWQHGLRHAQGADAVDIIDIPPGFGIGEVAGCPIAVAVGAVHQPVDAPECTGRGFRQRSALIGLGDIGGALHRLPAGRLDLLGNLFQIGPAAGAQSHSGALRRGQLGKRLPQARPDAADDDDLALQQHAPAPKLRQDRRQVCHKVKAGASCQAALAGTAIVAGGRRLRQGKRPVPDAPPAMNLPSDDALDLVFRQLPYQGAFFPLPEGVDSGVGIGESFVAALSCVRDLRAAPQMIRDNSRAMPAEDQ